MDDQSLVFMMINDCETIVRYTAGMDKTSFQGLRADAVARRLAGLREKTTLLSKILYQYSSINSLFKPAKNAG